MKKHRSKPSKKGVAQYEDFVVNCYQLELITVIKYS